MSDDTCAACIKDLVALALARDTDAALSLDIFADDAAAFEADTADTRDR